MIENAKLHFTSNKRGKCDICKSFRKCLGNTSEKHEIKDTQKRVILSTVRGGVEKSLARPGKKKATAINPGIYST